MISNWFSFFISKLYFFNIISLYIFNNHSIDKVPNIHMKCTLQNKNFEKYTLKMFA